MKEYTNYFFKGIAVGVANIIPGVSGGTIALITGIFERLINAIKAFDVTAAKLLFTGKWKAFAEKTDFYFLLTLFVGIALAIITLARVFDYLFRDYPVYIWSYFFGLVLASIYFVAKTIERWNFVVILLFVLGTAFAVFVSLINPAAENSNFWYLFLCGIVAICSMILPGLSGSFVLILMGNYELVAIQAINNRDLSILFPVALGAIIGLIAFSHLLSWVFKRYKDQTIAVLTGFILGSLNVLWPWKTAEYLKNSAGELILKHGEKVVARYASVPPQSYDKVFWIAVFVMVLGILSITVIELMAGNEAKGQA
ncbi:Integral membrane protein [hydrothermal vent metagenome]|uniref:Integral membrane protein n=1 Tax=hydrothermal vent metagenome TaxID=652676 RepID=A0A3B0V5G2_9ZZZZ